MSRKHVIQGFAVLDGAAATSNQTSAETAVDMTDKMSYHVVFSASNSGTFTVEAKNGDKDSWYALNFGSALTISSETDVQIILNECPFTKIRLKWVPSAGSGTMTARVTTKSVGA
jgi:hypothetical protein